MKNNHKGYSLVELLAAIAIIMILTSVLAPAVVRKVEDANKSKALQEAQVVFDAARKAVLNAKSDPESSEAFSYVCKFKAPVDGSGNPLYGTSNDVQYGVNSSQSLNQYLNIHYYNATGSFTSKSGDADKYICSQIAKEVPDAMTTKLPKAEYDELSKNANSPRKAKANHLTTKYISDHPEKFGDFVYAMCFEKSGRIVYFQCVYRGYFIQFDGNGAATVEKVDDDLSNTFNDWPSTRFDYATGW